MQTDCNSIVEQDTFNERKKKKKKIKLLNSHQYDRA